MIGSASSFDLGHTTGHHCPLVFDPGLHRLHPHETPVMYILDIHLQPAAMLEQQG